MQSGRTMETSDSHAILLPTSVILPTMRSPTSGLYLMEAEGTKMFLCIIRQITIVLMVVATKAVINIEIGDEPKNPFAVVSLKLYGRSKRRFVIAKA